MYHIVNHQYPQLIIVQENEVPPRPIQRVLYLVEHVYLYQVVTGVLILHVVEAKAYYFRRIILVSDWLGLHC